MALMLTAGASFHWVKRLSAETNTKGVLKIIVHGDSNASENQYNDAEILCFTEDAEMVARLVKAINGACEVEPRTAAGSLD